MKKVSNTSWIKSKMWSMKQLSFTFSFIVLFLIGGISSSYGQVTETFTVDGSWTVPAGVTRVTIQVWGAGGGGAGGDSGNEDGGGGGGGGGYSTSVDVVVVPGAVHAYTVGQGGNGGNDQQDGFDGEASTMLGVTANGGAGGNCDDDAGNRNGGAGGTGTTSNGGDGGNGVNNNGAGGGGEGGCTTGDGEDGNNGNGAGTDGEGGNNCDGGDGGQGNQSNDGPGSPGSGPGGGGGGGTDDDGDGDGGDGADGRIVITYTVTVAECNPCYSVATGDFDDPATWSDVSGGAAGFTPESDGTGDFFIEGTYTVNMNTSFSVNDITIGTGTNGVLQWTAADVTLTVGGGGTLTVANGSELNENTQTNAKVKFNAGGSTYGLVVGDVTPGFVIDDLIMVGDGTLNISGAGTIAVTNDFKVEGSSATINNNLTGSFTVGNDVLFAVTGSGGSVQTIWSEDFESYADNTEAAANNNTANPAVDWTRTPHAGLDDHMRVESDNALTGNRSFETQDSDNGASVWETEEISIVGYTNVTLSIRHDEFDDMNNSDYIDIDYQLDGGAWTDWVYQQNDYGETVSTQAGLSGSTVKIRVSMENGNDDGSASHVFDDVTVVGTTPGSGGDDNNVFNVNQNITVSGDFIFAGSNNVCNSGATLNVSENLYLSGKDGGSVTLWSEDFESYADNAGGGGAGGADNQGAAGVDWTNDNGGSDDYWRVESDNAIAGSRSFSGKETDGNVDWYSEIIDITGYSSVSGSVLIGESGDNESNEDYIYLYYELNGSGTWVEFDNQWGDFADRTATFSGLTGTSLRLWVRVFNDTNDEIFHFDNIVVTGSNVYTGDNCVYNNTGTVGLTKDLIFSSSTNVFNNNGTVTIAEDLIFADDAYTCGFVAGNPSTTAVTDSIIFENQTASHNNYLTNDGTLTGVTLNMDQSDIIITNNSNGTFTLTNDMFSDDDTWQVINAGTMTLIDFETDDADDNNFTITNSGTLNFRNYDGGNAQTQIITNTGTINQEGTFQNIAAAQTTFTNGANGRWNYEGTGHDVDVRIYCTAADNVFNYNRSGSAQQMIRPQTDDYHHLEITNTPLDGASVKTPLSSYVIDIAGNLTISGSASLDVDAQNNNITIAGNWINTSSVGFVEGTETVDFDGAGAQFITCSTILTESFYDLIFSNSGTTTINPHLDIEDDIVISGTAVMAPVATRNIFVGDDWTNYATGGFTENDSHVQFDGGGDQTITCTAGTENFYDVTFKNAGTVTANPHLDIEDDIAIEDAAILAPAATRNIFVGDDWTNYATGGFTEGTSTVEFDGGADQSISNAGGTENFYNVSFTNGGTTSSNAMIDVANDITFTGTAVLNPNNNTVFVGRHWANSSSGGFTEGTGTVTFDGAAGQNLTCSNIGTETFHNLTINKSAGGTVTMNNHVALTSAGILNFSGTNGYIALNTNNFTIADWAAGDITGYDTDEFFIVDNTGFIKYTGVDAGEVLNVPMGLSAGATNYALAELTMTNAGAGTFDANMCGDVQLDGGLCDGAAIAADAVDYTWNFVSTSNNAVVKLYWDAAKELGGFTRATSRVMHHNGTDWDQLSVGGAATSEGGTLYSRSGTTTGFSPYAVQDDDQPLPVELLSFTAVRDGNSTVLTWVTGAEINNESFTIERSLDGVNFEEIGYVRGAGNSYAEIDYMEYDYSPGAGVNYYRIKQTDFDGTVSYSFVLQVDLNTESATNLEAAVFPNPVKNGERIFVNIVNNGDEKEVLIVMRSPLGQEVFSKFIVVEEYGNVVSAIDVQGRVAPGVYIITGSSDQRLFQKKIVIK